MSVELKEKLWDCVKVYSNLVKLFFYILCIAYMLIEYTRYFYIVGCILG